MTPGTAQVSSTLYEIFQPGRATFVVLSTIYLWNSRHSGALSVSSIQAPPEFPHVLQ